MADTPVKYLIQMHMGGEWVTVAYRSRYRKAIAHARRLRKEMSYAYPVSVIGEGWPEDMREMVTRAEVPR